MQESRNKHRYKKPQEKKRSKKAIVLLVFQYVFLAAFLVSVSLILYNKVLLPNQVDSALSSIESELLAIMDETEYESNSETEIGETSSGAANEESENKITPEMKDRSKIPASLRKLQNKYEDLIGWIKINNTVVNFPVMQSDPSSPNFYLRRDYLGNYSKYGSIYLDNNCSKDDDIGILYGHSMNDGRMFSCLLDLSDPENLKKSPVIQYDTPDGIGDYKIVSIFKTNTRYSHGSPFNYIDVDFENDEEKMQFVYECMIRSVVDTNVDIDDEDEFILLSTCSYEFEDFRTGILARKVRPDESSEVDIDDITASPNPLYPDVWYETYGGKKPNYPDTLKEAFNLGLAPWYIGDLLK